MKPIRPIRIEGDIAYVPLTKGYTAIIDAEDAELIGQNNWNADVNKNTVYALRGYRQSGKHKIVRMHREIAKTPNGFETDHIDGDGLNNVKVNLRHCTNGQNARNRKPYIGGTSKYKGVGWSKEKGKWRAQIKHKSVPKHLGYFDCEQEAYAAYCKASAEIHKEFGRVI